MNLSSRGGRGRGGRGSGRGGRGGGRGGRGGGKYTNNGYNHKDNDHKSSSLNQAQEEMKHQCQIMSSIDKPDNSDLRFQYLSNNDNTVDMTQEMAFCINGTVYRKFFYDPGPISSKKEKCVIVVTNDTAIQTARILHSKDFNNICIMNFANPDKPGGAYEQGRLSQESSLISQTLLLSSLRSRTALPFYESKHFKKSNNNHYNNHHNKNSSNKNSKFMSSDDSDSSGPYKKSKPSTSHYHHNTNHGHQAHSKPNFTLDDNGLIYSPRVPVIADGEASTISIPSAKSGKKSGKDNKFIMFDKEDVFYVDIASVSPINRTKVLDNCGKNDTKKVEKEIRKLMERKIRNTIYMSAMRADYLILGAFGCGSFGNDPKQISRIFRKVLIKQHYANYFKRVHFAIGGNKQIFDIFKNTFDTNKHQKSDDDDDSDDDNGTSENDNDDDGYRNEYDNQYDDYECEEEQPSKNKKKSGASIKKKKYNDYSDNNDYSD